MQTNKILMIIFWQIFSLKANCQIVSSYSIKSSTVQNYIKAIDKDTLVVFNIADTVLMPKSSMFAYQNPYRNFIETLIAASKNNSAFDTAIITWFTNRKLSLVEPDLYTFIKEIQGMGAVVVGLDQMPRKITELIKEPELLRYNELANLGVYFTEKIGSHLLLKLSEDPNKLSIFFKGIIFVRESTKSEAVLNFLKTSNLRPKKIIMFDCNRRQLKQTERALRKFDIDFVGINYLAISEIIVKPNEELIKFQQNTLLNDGKWLEDAEAANILKLKVQ